MSPTVVATWIARTEPRKLPELELLVLWRGAPGWFLRADSSGSSSRISTRSGRTEEDHGLVVSHLSLGGIDLNLEFDRRKHLARVDGNEVALEADNVLLVDDVDGEDGPRIERTLQVDPAFPESPARIEEIVRRSPEVFAYLQCDVRLPDAKARPMIEAICAKMKGQ